MEENEVLIEYMDKAVKRKVSIELDNISLIRLSVKIQKGKQKNEVKRFYGCHAGN